MTIASRHPHSLVVQHDRLSDYIEQRYAGWHAGVPVLMAMSIVCIAATAILLSISPKLALPVNLLMAALMLGAAVLALVSMVLSGEVIEAKFDDHNKLVHLLYRGPTAHSEWHIPFSRISAARMAMSYSAKGVKELTPTLELTDGSKICLPDATTWDDIEQIRAMLATLAPEPSQEAWSKKESVRATNRRRPGKH